MEWVSEEKSLVPLLRQDELFPHPSLTTTESSHTFSWVKSESSVEARLHLWSPIQYENETLISINTWIANYNYYIFQCLQEIKGQDNTKNIQDVALNRHNAA